MKNIKIWLVLITMAFTLTACGSASSVSSVTVSAQSSTGQLGGGSGSYTLDINVKDNNGTGVANQLISLEVSTVNTGAISNTVGVTNFSILPAEMRTDANGFLTVSVTHTNVAGELIYVRAVSEGGVKSAWQSLDFAATSQGPAVTTSTNVGAVRIDSPNDYTNAFLTTAGQIQIVGDGVLAYSVTVQVEDANGNPLIGEVVTFSKTSSSAAPGIAVIATDTANLSSSGSIITNTSGVVKATISNLKGSTETWSISATAGGVTSNILGLKFIGSGTGSTTTTKLPNNARTLVLGSPLNSSLTANGADAYKVSVLLLDNTLTPAEPLQNQTIKIGYTSTLQTGGGTPLIILAPQSGRTDASGIFEFEVKEISGVADQLDISANFTDVTSGQKFSSATPLRLDFLGSSTAAVGGGLSTGLSFTVARTDPYASLDQGRLPADGAVAAVVAVETRDSYGNLADPSGNTITATSSGSAVVSAATRTATGKYEFTVINTVAETTNIGFAEIGGGASSFNGLIFVPAVSSLTISPQLLDENNGLRVNFLATSVDTARIVFHVKDASGQPVANETIKVTSDSYSAVLPASVVTNALGEGFVDLKDAAAETVRVTLTTRSGGLLPGVVKTDFVDVPFVPTPQQKVNSVGITLDKFSVLSDNKDVIRVTVSVKDSSNGVVEGVIVDLYASAGQISPSSRLTTDALGVATASFSAGTLRANGTVTLSASVNAPSAAGAVGGLVKDAVAVAVTGTTIVLAPANTALSIGGVSSKLTATAADAAGNPIANAVLTVTQAPVTATGSLTLSATSLTTDNNGQAVVDVYASVAGTVRVSIAGLGATATQDYTTAGLAFGIASPTTSPYSLATNSNLTISVNNPTASDSVMFVTDYGTWDAAGVGTINAGKAVIKTGATTLSAVFNSPDAFPTHIQVINTTTNDVANLILNVSAATNTASTVSLQAGRNVLQPDHGAGGESTVLTANVRNAAGAAVGNTLVLFTITNPTGGGETVSSIVTSTDAFGRATTTFTAGSKSTGGNGVSIKAEVLGATISDTVSIVIGGTPGSVVIGESSQIFIHGNTTYKLPMSVMVADTNGNPMANTTVSLGAWPIKYSTGAYIRDADDICSAAITGTFANEDSNENTFLDAGEDSNGDSQITPPNSASGTLPATVTTDEFGLAVFDLVYPKSSASWITDRIRASTSVLGSATTSELETRLAGEKGELESCLLPNSPFSNVSATNVKVSLSPQSTVTVGQAVQLDALVADTSGNPVLLETVTFAFVGAANGKTLSRTSAKSGSGGIASIIVQDLAGTGGPISIKATSGLSSSTSNITFLTTISDPYALAVSASPTSGAAPDGATPVVITASVRDIYGVSVANAPIRFETKDAVTLDTFQTQTGANGQASANVTATQAGNATITVSLLDQYANVDKYTNVTISFGVTPASLSLTSAVSAVPADGSLATITATVWDTAGKPIQGEVVNLTVSGSAVLSSSSVTTDVKGVASFTLTNTVNELVSVQAVSQFVAGVNDTLGMTFTRVVSIVEPYSVVFTNALDASTTPVTPLNKSLTFDVYTTTAAADTYASYASGLDTVLVKYRVRDNADAAISGLEVSFSSGGSAVISPAKATSDANGFVSVTVTDAYAELITVSAVTGGKTGNQQLAFSALPSSSIQLTSTNPAPAVIGLSGSGVQQSASLLFTVVDSNNNPAQGSNIIDFSILNGGLNGGEKLTVQQASTVNGQVTAVINAGEISGTVQIRAALNNDNTIFTDIPVTITGGLPSGDSFTLTSGPLNIHGLDILGVTQDITAHISDFFSNPVSPGQQVQFQTDFANTSGSAVFSDLGANGLSTGSSRASGFVVSAAPVPVDGFVTLEASTIGGAHSKVLSVAAVDANTIYVGTDGGGVFKTGDAGGTWLQVGTPLKGLGASKTKDLVGSIVRGLTVAPNHVNFVYAATNQGLFMSSDAGQSWAPLMNRKRIVGDNLGTVGVADVITNANNLNGRLGVATTPTTFTFNYTHTKSRARTKVFVNGVQTNSYYLLNKGIQLIGQTVGGNKSTLDGVTISTNNKVTADYDTASSVPRLPLWDVVVDKNSTFDAVKGYQNIYVGVYGGGVWKSVDYGQSWVKKAAMLNNDTFDNRVTSLAISSDAVPANSDLFAGTDGGGLYRSTDAGDTWDRIGGLPNTVVQDVTLDPYVVNQPYRVWVAGKNGVHSTADAYSATPTWTAGSGLGANLDIRAVALNDDATYAYAAAYGDITGNSQPLGGIYKAAVGSNVWSKYANLDTSSIAGAHRIDALDVVGSGATLTNTIVAGTEGRSVYMSSNSGNTWMKKVGKAPTALTNALFTTVEVLHSGTTSINILPMTTTYQPMNDDVYTIGYTASSSMYHGETHEFMIQVADALGNRLMGGTEITVSVDKGKVAGATSAVLPDGTYGMTDYKVTWTNDVVGSEFIDVSSLAATLTVSVVSGNSDVVTSLGRTLNAPLEGTGLGIAVDPYATGPVVASIGATGGSNGVKGYTLAIPTACSEDNITTPSVCSATATPGVTTLSTGANASVATFNFARPGTGQTTTHAVTITDDATGVSISRTVTLTAN